MGCPTSTESTGTTGAAYGPSWRGVALALALAVPLSLSCGGDGGTGPGGDDGGDGGGTGGGSAVAVPGAFTAEPVSGSRIALSWTDPSADETGFEIQRSPDGSGDWSDVVVTAADVTTHEDTGLSEGTRYDYRIRTVRGGETSDWSAIAGAETLAGTIGTTTEIERVLDEVLPAPGTPIGDRDLRDEVVAAAEALRGMPGVDTVFPLEGVLATQAVLEDGTVFLFVNNRPAALEDADGGPAHVHADADAATRSAAGAPGRETGPRTAGGPPGSSRAVSVAFDGGASVASEVAGLLGKRGYDVTGLGATLADMRNYTNLGALYLDTHGVSYLRFEADEDGDPQPAGTAYALQTATVLPNRNLGPWQQELVDGDLVISLAEDASGNRITKFGITDSFIRKHWSFDEGVVMIHACYGGSGPFTYNGVDLDPTPIQQAVQAAGADVLVSFDHLTNASLARPSIMYFFDRMLGADTYDTEDPPLRPFDLAEVREGMQEEDLLEFDFPETQVFGLGLGTKHTVGVTFHGGGGGAAMAPSIRTMDIFDDASNSEGEMTLHGRFGDDQGSVTVDGAAVPVRSWSDGTIEVGVPFKGYAGEVVVESPGGIESNEAPLTEWSGDITLTIETKGTLQIETKIELRFRADVHAFRNGLDDDPEHRTVTAWINPASTGTSTGSGQYTENDATSTMHGTFDMRVLSKQEVQSLGGIPGSAVFGGKVELDPDAGTADVCLSAWPRTDVTVTADGQSETHSVVFPGLIPQLFDRLEGAMGCAEVDMGDDFFIGGHSETFSEEDASYSVEWSRFVPATPPSEDTAG